MNRSEIINTLIKKHGYKKYLEIGVGNCENYNLIECEYKTNVDPCFDNYDNQSVMQVVNKMTSDDFFKTNEEKFDIIFIDGLHVYEQVYQDIINSLQALNEGGSIVCHDMLPPTQWHQRPVDEYKGHEEWNGDCWKAVARLRMESNDLSIYTVDCDWGVSVISKGINRKFPGSIEKDLNYSFFEKTKFNLMNIVQPADFY